MKEHQFKIKCEENPRIEQTPSFERIQQRAYYKFMVRGGAPGHELEDWCAAEREVTEEQKFRCQEQRVSERGN